MRARRGRAWILSAAILAGLTQAGAAPPASAQEPAGAGPDEVVPVLVVPGWFDTAEALAGLRVRLTAAGWPPERVAAVTFARPTGSNHQHAEEIARAVDLLRRRTGAARVDVIAHSMGGLATRLFLREHPDAVRRVVFMATPHRGTLSAYFAFGEGRDEMMPGSPFLDSLNAAPAVPEGVEALTVRTFLDTHVVPVASATLPGVPDVTVCCSTHEGLTRSLEAFRAVRAFLREGRVVP